MPDEKKTIARLTVLKIRLVKQRDNPELYGASRSDPEIRGLKIKRG
ncbi:hypothetical protein [Paenibacillus sp. 1P03SA]